MKICRLLWIVEIATSATTILKQYFIREPDNQTAIEGEQVMPKGEGGRLRVAEAGVGHNRMQMTTNTNRTFLKEERKSLVF